MEAALQVIGHIIVTVIAVMAIALRIEHRLTKIETDIAWLKNMLNKINDCKGDTLNDKFE